MLYDGKYASKTRAKSNKWSLCGVALYLFLFTIYTIHLFDEKVNPDSPASAAKLMRGFFVLQFFAVFPGVLSNCGKET